MMTMPIPREDVTRLLGKIDQQLADVFEQLEKRDLPLDDETSVLYGAVCLDAARRLAEDKLNSGHDLQDDDWRTLLSLYRLSNSWFG
jgi:hypothetical protein